MKLRWLGPLASIALLALVAYQIAANWQELPPIPRELKAGPLLASAGLLGGAYWLRAGLYAWLLRRVEPQTRGIVASKIFFASQAGRYLPGKVWQFAGAGMLAGLHGVGVSAAVWSSAVVAVLHHLMGSLIGLFIFQRDEGAQMEMALPIAALGVGALLFLSSALPRHAIRWVAARLKRDPGSLVGESWPSFGILLALSPLLALVWLLFGLSLMFLVAGTLPPDTELSTIQATSIIAASCVAGYLAIIAPSGLGVREATMTALLAPLLGLPAAGMIAIAMRIEMTLVEGLLIGWGLMSLRNREVGRK